MSNGVLGLTRPANGTRDLVGMRAWRLNTARERLIKEGRPVGTLTLADLEAEAVRWEEYVAADRQAEAADEAARDEAQRAFMQSYRVAEPGDEIGPDRDGRHYIVDENYDLEVV